MDLDLKGKAVLVTGGSRGIGFACAQAFMGEGARVGIASRDRGRLDAALARLPGAEGFRGDLGDDREARGVVEDFVARIGPIDILVNSAGAARRTPPDDLTPEAYRAAMDAKYFSYVNVIDPVVKAMAARGQGVIVNIVGNGGKMASPIHIPGGAANAALMLVTAGLANAYAGRGLRVVAVNPGLTDTERVTDGLVAEARLKETTQEEARRAAVARIPMGRMAEPSEIASMVVFLASPAASYVTGVSISMDGAAAPLVV